MNMEDRLKEAFEQEAEHLHAPHGSADTAMRRGRRRRASNLIGGAALVLTLIGGTAAGFQLLGTSEDPGPNELASSTESSQPADESVTVTSNAGVADFVWERATLPKPEGTDVWNIQVAARDGGFVAIGSGYTPRSEEPGERILVWESPDGIEWSLTASALPFDGRIDTLLNTGDGFVAVVRSFDGASDSTSLYFSADGTTWTDGSADLGPLANNQHLWFVGAASGNGTTVLAGTIQTEPPEPPVVLEEAGLVLQLDHFQETFTVSDLATGEVITVISSEAIYGRGPAVYGPDGEEIVVLSEDVLEAAYQAGFEEVLVVEQDGIRVEINYLEHTFVATDIASETVVASGNEDDLYQAPRIVVVDPDTNETIVDMDIDEYYRAQDEAYGEIDGYFPQSELVLLASRDGAKWDRVDLPNDVGEEINVSGVGYGPNGFLVSVNSYGPDRAELNVWRSADGLTWEPFSPGGSNDPVEGPIVSDGKAYYRLSYNNRAGIARSSDGVEWTVVHEPGDRGTYYNSLASGGLGIVAVGQHSEDSYGPPLVIAKDGRTLMFDTENGRITVTEDATGEVLTTIELDVYQLEAPEQIIEDPENGTITITDVDGTVVMEFTEDDAMAASEQADYEYEYLPPESAVAFSPDGEEWFTATSVGLDVAWAQNVAVGDEAVVIVGESAEFYADQQYGSGGEVTVELESGSGYGTETTLVDGSTVTTTIAADYSPTTYVWVGRPR